MSGEVRVREMGGGDIDAVAALHASEMAASLTARLGGRFLRKLYRYLREEASFHGFVAEDETGPIGFAAMTIDSEGFLRRICARHLLSLGGSVLARGLLRPALLFEAYGVLGSQTPDARPAGERAELLAIGVRQDARGRGTGRRLVEALRETVRAAGKRTLGVVVEEGIPAHEFYRAEGFEEKARFRLHGADARFYVLAIG